MLGSMIGRLGAALLVGSNTGGGIGGGGLVVHMVASEGNSHRIGRCDEIGGDAFPAKVQQWTQAGVLAPIPAGQVTLQGGDASTTEYGPDVQFAKDYLAANPGIDMLVFVPTAIGSTALVDNPSAVPNDGLGNNWRPGSGSLFDAATARWTACRNYLIAQGYNVTVVGALTHFANPDYADNQTTRGYPAYQASLDAMLDGYRARPGFTAQTPIVIGSGMNKPEMDASGVTEYVITNAIRSGSHRRRAGVAVADVQNPRYGFSTGVPVQLDTPDTIHANHDGEDTKGHLFFNALARAAANTTRNGSLGALSIYNSTDLAGLWDFRTGYGRDWSGNGFDLLANANAGTLNRYPLFAFESLLDDYVHVRSSGASWRSFYLAGGLPTSYTKLAFFKPDDFATAFSIWGVTAGAAANADNHRLQFSFSTNQLQAGHGSTATQLTVANGNTLLSASAYNFVALGYDNPTQTMTMWVNGTQVGTVGSVAAHTGVNGGAIGAASQIGSAPTNAMLGRHGWYGLAKRMLTAGEITAVQAACVAMAA